MIPSKRTYLLLLLGSAIALSTSIIWNVQTSIVVTLLFDAIVFGLMFVDNLRAKPYRVHITRTLPPRLSIGRDNPVVLSITSKNCPVEIQICDRPPTEFKLTQRVLSTSLPSNTTTELTYTVSPIKRGEFDYGDIQVRQLGSWGLSWDSFNIYCSQKVKVYPDLLGLKSLSIRLTLQSSGALRKMRTLGMGTEFAELRDYGKGDDLRLIDWKATARRDRPLIRVLEPEQEQTLIILLDRGRLMTAQVQGLKRFDWGMNATLSLALAGLNRGDRVGVGVFDRQMHLWIQPQRGQHQLSHLIDRLTPIQPVLLESDYMGAVTNVVQQQTRRALVVLITDIVDSTASAELLTAMGRLAPRYLPFCVTLGDRQVAEIARTPTLDITTTYTRAVAIDLLAQRQLAFAKLKQKGVLVLDAPCDRLSEQIVDRYLQLKARNQL